jgi:Cu-processing system permease protein
MMIANIYSITKKEILDNIRNKWVIILTVIFTALTLLASYAGSIMSSGWQDLSGTIGSMIVLVQYLISIIALILGYSAIIGEIESGSMNSLLSLPTTRNEILLGKFFGLGTILSISILIGFGLAGIIIGLNVGSVNYGEYFFFIAASILMGLIFLSIGFSISTIFKKRSSAMGVAIFTWIFFAIIWIFIITAIVIATNPNLLSVDPSQSPGDIEVGIPEIIYTSDFFNPISAYSRLISLNVGTTESTPYENIELDVPDYINSTNMFITMCIWLFSFLLISFWRFNKKDI